MVAVRMIDAEYSLGSIMRCALGPVMKFGVGLTRGDRGCTSDD